MKTELLAPAGNFKSLTAAIKAGADAVYLGLKDFNMRDTAQNFSLAELSEVSEICKKAGVKIYLTLNTIIYDSEIKKIDRILRKVKNKVDAIICWDMSVIQLCRKHKIPFHISTQASIANSEAAKMYKRLGAERAVLARELNIKQIKKISKIIQTEVFIHGAMCVAISGRCFTSQFLHGKSANAGQCRHPCRKAYQVKDEEGNELQVKNNKIFSAKDLCTLPFLDKLKKAGITAFKIEGRSREPEYVYTVTNIYRKALDKKLNKEEIASGLLELEKVYNRSFSSGFYLKTPTADDFSTFQGSGSKETKIFLGKIKHYWKKPGVAAIKLNNAQLKLGDEIIVTGKNTFFKHEVDSMEIHHRQVKQVKKSQTVGIKIPEARENDEVYLVVKRNQQQ